jgi:rsbT co-antagonist protein RsbR
MMLGMIFNDIIDVFHIYLEGKEKTILAQQEGLRNLRRSRIWDGVALPIIGPLDFRTMIVVENSCSASNHRARWWSSTSPA